MTATAKRAACRPAVAGDMGRITMRMRWGAGILVTLGMAIALFGGGCGGTVPATHYYLIDYEMPPMTAGDSTLAPSAIALGVEGFSTQPVYRDRRIAYRLSGNEVVYYPYRYWAAAPGDLVADQLAEHVRQSHLFRSVEVAPYGRTPDWVLSGHVAQFEEVVVGGQAMARLDLSVRLESVKTGELFWEDSIAAQQPVQGQAADQIAAAMSRAMLEAGNEVVGKLRAQITQQAAR
jgi:ABC-type uncharacterized transport system auxiliary subunit